MKSEYFIFLLILFLFCANNAWALSSDNIKLSEHFAEKAHEYFEDKNFPKAGDYYEKAYKTGKIDVYKENSIIAYLRYAFDCMNEKKYDSAITYCEKALSLEKNNNDAKEILSDIYYSRASDLYYRGKEKIAKKDLVKSLEYGALTEQKQRARDLLSKISNKKNSNNLYSPFIKKTSDANPLPAMLELMELKLYGQSFENLSLYQRVNKLEKEVYGKTYYEKDLISRVKKLKEKICPELVS